MPDNNHTRIITDANTPDQHRINLAAMMIAYLSTDQPEDDQKDVHATFTALDTFLKLLEGS